MLCGCLTVSSPLLRYGCGPGKNIGIVGITGIGHMGILFAKAMGSEVYDFSRFRSKREDSLTLGADHYIATAEDKDFATKYLDTLEVMVVCANSLS